MTQKDIQWEFIPDTDLSYLKQPDEVYNIQHSDYYKYHTDGNNHFRKIFYKCEYTDFENKHLKALKEEIQNQNIQLPPNWDDASTLKYCYTGSFTLKKSIEFLRMHLEWRQNFFMQKMTKQAEKILEDGVFYHLGRDKQLRPILVLNVWRVNPKQIPLDIYLSAICNLLNRITQTYFVKGHVENWIVILELNEKGVADLEIGTIKSLVQIMAKNFTSTLEKMFIMNPTLFFSGMWTILKNVVHPETAAKINILKKKDFGQLLQFIDANQLEVKYGGTIPDKTIYWPPQNTLKQTKSNLLNPEDAAEGNNLDISSLVSYKSIENDSEMFFNQNILSHNKNGFNSSNNNINGEELNKINNLSQPTNSNDSCCKCSIF